MSNSVKSRFFWSPIFNLVLFNWMYSWILLSQISICPNFRFLEVNFQSLIYKSIQILFIMSKLSIKSINKPVKVSTAVFSASDEIYFDNLIIICEENLIEAIIIWMEISKHLMLWHLECSVNSEAMKLPVVYSNITHFLWNNIHLNV